MMMTMLNFNFHFEVEISSVPLPAVLVNCNLISQTADGFEFPTLVLCRFTA